jgi:hypothetical protein
MTGLITLERDFYAGIDIGQVNDSTAIVILERIKAAPREGLHHALRQEAIDEARAVPVRLDLVDIERIPLGTLYPEQVARITDALRFPLIEGVRTYLDMTGVGRPVLQMLREAGVRDMHGISITSAKAPATRTPNGWNVGKAELVNAVQIEMQTGRLRFGHKVEHVEKLVRELKEFRARINASGNTTFNAREGQHDDLVLALSYAVFGALCPTPVTTLDVRFAA